MKYVCDVCGYVYDPEIGDPDTALMQAQHGKMYPRIGYALSVV